MRGELEETIARIKGYKNLTTYDEAATKQAIILPILHALGWNIYDIEEVKPEFPVENRKVDYALRLSERNEVFIEAKKPYRDLKLFQEQLLDYSWRQGVDLACLTDGLTWWFYLSMKKVPWKERKFYTIDLMNQETAEIVDKFIELFSKERVETGQAIASAENMLKGQLRRKQIEETLPEAWNMLINEESLELVEILATVTEKLCGFKPDDKEVRKFLSKHRSGLIHAIEDVQLPERDEARRKLAQKPKTSRLSDREVTREMLVGIIIQVLKKYDGKASKKIVEQDIWQMYKEQFPHAWHQGTVSHGVPRWKHNIAWAKENAKHRGMIKKPAESGRGIWELTERGWETN